MKKISGILLGAVCWVNALNAYATEKFDILPDLLQTWQINCDVAFANYPWICGLPWDIHDWTSIYSWVRRI